MSSKDGVTSANGAEPAEEVAGEKLYELADVIPHGKEEDCWLVIDGSVYDVTPFLDEHPGGFDIILASTGKDATEDFDEIGHSKSAREMLSKYRIGKYKGGKTGAPKLLKPSAVKLQGEPGGGVLLTTLKFLLPIVVIAAIFLPKYLSQ